MKLFIILTIATFLSTIKSGYAVRNLTVSEKHEPKRVKLCGQIVDINASLSIVSRGREIYIKFFNGKDTVIFCNGYNAKEELDKISL